MTSRMCPIAVALVFCCFAGCTSNQPEKPASDGSGSAEKSESGYKRRTVAELPAVSDYLPPLDDGRIEIAGPDGWKTLPRSNKSLAGFVKGKASELPRIVVTVGDPPAPKLADTSEDNADVLGAILETQLRKDSTKRIPEHCLPIVLGDRTYIRHVRLATLAGDPAVIQSLQTVHGGRLYTVELICNVNAADGREYVKSLKTDRDFGYAVAANLKFGSTTDPLANVAAEPANEPPPAEPTPSAVAPPGNPPPAPAVAAPADNPAVPPTKPGEESAAQGQPAQP